VLLLVGEHQLVRVLFSALVHVPYVTTNLHTPSKVEQAVIAQSTLHSKARDQVNFVDVDGNDILKRRC
jgi:hypothetical protein